MPFAVVAASLLLGCSHPHTPKPLEMEPIGTIANVPTSPREDGDDSGVTTPNSGTPSPNRSPCNVADGDSIEDLLKQCDVAMPRLSEATSIKEKLEVRVSANPSSVTPGGRLELLVTLRNRSSEPLPLYFTGDPTPRFDVEASDLKGRRVDLPAGKWPGYPKGFKPEAREAKAARIILEKGAAARLKVTWDAVKTKWAPDRARVWEGRGFPRIASAPLGPGKYMLRVAMPLLGDAESAKLVVDVAP